MDIRLRRKAVFLVGDLAECQLENLDNAEMPFFSNQFFLKSVVDLTASSDLDLQEKVVVWRRFHVFVSYMYEQLLMRWWVFLFIDLYCVFL